MRLVSYTIDGRSVRGGVLVDSGVVDLATATGGSPDGAAVSVRDLLRAGGPDLTLEQAVARRSREAVPLAEVSLAAPVADPDKILCIGLNYRDHAEEAGLALPEVPMVFAKFRNSLVGPQAPVIIPPVSTQIDFEGELAVVIGRRATRVREADALAHVAGGMVLNDVTARDVQLASSQWTLGKAIDTFAPCGPALVTLDELGPLDDLRLTTRVNGRTVQDGSTANMIFTVPRLVAHISRTMTLEPGDIIATGTPAGVGFTRNPPLYLQSGDVVTVEIEGVGAIRNPLEVLADPAPSAPVFAAG